MTNECRIIQCYSCSDGDNSTLSNSSTIQTAHDEDQCIVDTIFFS